MIVSQIKALTGHHASVTLTRERPWASITFAGTRHSFAVDCSGDPETERMQNLVKALPDHEFAIPGYFVADILVTGQSEKQIFLEALSIIDPAKNAGD
tara:strand:- start:8521 stop:8814 length:294 start_codon:yes stop_codon:yes gene_type:complete